MILVHLLKRTEPTIYSAAELTAIAPSDNPIASAPSLGAFRSPHGLFTPAWGFHNWSLDPLTFSLGDQFVIAFSQASPDFGIDNHQVVPNDIVFQCAWEDLTKGLPFRVALQRRQNDTERWMESDLASQSVSLKNGEESISDIWDRWSATTHHPVIMEVLPDRNGHTEFGGNQSITTTIKSYCEGVRQEAIVPSLLRTPWTVEESDGVTIFRDELRFIDHAIRVNPNADIRLRKGRETSKDGLNTIADLIDASNLLDIEDNARTAESRLYEQMQGFPYVQPYIRLVQSDPAGIKALKEISVGETIQIPYRQFSPDARRQFEKSVKRLAVCAGSHWSSALVLDFDAPSEPLTVTIRAQKEESIPPRLAFQTESPSLEGQALLVAAAWPVSISQ